MKTQLRLCNNDLRALIFQIKALEQKLIEFRTSHQKEEEDLEDAVRTMEDQLFEVKSDMEKRMRNLNLAFDSAHSSSPHGKQFLFNNLLFWHKNLHPVSPFA